MKRTYSVKDGGRLCVCGHIKAEHEDGQHYCRAAECRDGDNECYTFRDRAPETEAA